MRGWKVVSRWGVAAVLIASMVAGRASAVGCFTCDATLNCAGADQGAKFCLQGPMTCTLALPCFSGPRRAPDGEALTAWSLFEVEALAGAPATPGVEPDAGPLSVGETMRSARAHGRAPLADATLAFGSDLAVVLSDATGEGFALRRTDQPGGVRLEVLEVQGDQPGRTLADAILRPRDRLRVRIHTAGRDHLLVLQADTVPPGLARSTIARLQSSLREAANTLPERREPLLKARAF
jgi:hypothetical protein